MDFSLFSALGAPLVFAAIFVAVFAGVVKGTLGFAMPLIILSGLGAFLDPKLALAGLILPTVVSNALQTFRGGIAQFIETVQLFWRYLLIIGIAIFLTAQVAAQLPTRVFYGALAVPVIIVSLIQLLGFRLTIRTENRLKSQWVMGGISGIMGGLAGTWGPTTVLYLLAIDTPKNRQMVVQGVIYGFGSFILFGAHLNSGILNAQTALFSAMLVVPGIIGMMIGFRIQDRLNQALFRKLTLIFLMIAGVNLLRRAIMG